MASNFPTSLDAFTNPSSTDAMDSVSVPHATQHSDLNDAVEALEAKVGADSSAVTSSHDYKIAQLEAISHGKILQVVSAYKSDTFTTTSATPVDITGLSVNITPASTSSKILVMSQTSVGSPSATNFTLKIARDSTEISKIVFSRHFSTALDSFTLATVDSPATTSTTTYKNQIAVGSGSVNVNVGSNAVYEGTSSIIVMEIAG